MLTRIGRRLSARRLSTYPHAFGDAAHQEFQHQAPSDKQLAFAQDLASQGSIELPDEAHICRRSCSAFIDEQLSSLPPTPKQLNYASSLADGMALRACGERTAKLLRRGALKHERRRLGISAVEKSTGQQRLGCAQQLLPRHAK